MKKPLDLTIPLSGSPSMISLEKRPYHSDSTPEEVDAIKDRVFVYQQEIIYIKEIPVLSSFSINLVFNKVMSLAKTYNRFGIIIDLSESDRPDADTRRTIGKCFKQICDTAVHVSFCTGGRLELETYISYIFHGVDVASYSINKDADSEILATKNALS
ncbi:MAG: hypothetical protein AB8G15_06590 [Saprospiraceae bacterium]